MNCVIDELYFGGTQVRFIEGKLLEHLSAGIYIGANAQGVMVAGLAAEIRRAAGAEVERELRGHNVLSVGEAYLTGPGMLAERGVAAIAHGVVVPAPGDAATLDRSSSALLAGLRLLEATGCRSVTVPQIGWRVSNVDPSKAAAELGRVVITHLRRKSRLESVSIVSSHNEYLDFVLRACRRYIDLEGRAGENDVR
ncbi:hypothetical protein BH24CHL1_BH24CHL1_06310 [soil metagenome]